MSQHQNPSGSKTTKPTHKDRTPSMDFLDEEILDVIPLSVISGEAPDSNHPMDASASACPTQGNSSSIPSSSTHATSSKEDMHHINRVIRNLSEKHDSANNVIDLEDDRSDDQDDSLLHHLKPSVAKRMRLEKSKVDVKKRKAREVSEFDEDVEEDVPDICPVKRTTVRKSLVKVVVVHLDNIFFHLEDGVAKWKFVIQRRLVVERELGKDVDEVKEVMDLIKNVGLMKTVVGLSQCYEELVKEFIINIPEDIADKTTRNFVKFL
ncbi:uncharacterized protein LOC127104337 [Lathyrus oleraceus]|uniref:uncharacterized protein LOC127104337 n=1 Tax=Pisum sativum TaxID=3888 RepID=UPI0021D172C9|nr:uncharacterized protein LOC127104337 [Pisum sativum]